MTTLDVYQSHLIQLMTLVAMEPPVEFTADGNLGNVWGSELGVAEPDRFGRGPDDPLWRFRGLEPKWERVKDNPRRYTSWIESLDDPDNWLRPSDLQR